MIDFQPVALEQKKRYEAFLKSAGERGCEYSFANLYLWGRQRGAVVEGCLALFSQFNRRSIYPFPVGPGDQKAVLDAIIADSRERGIACRMAGLNREECLLLDRLYPGRFRVHCDRDGFDYVYAVDDLADLKGRKLQRKRNHVHRFWALHPHCAPVPLSRELAPALRDMAKAWYETRLSQDPQGDYHMEKAALSKALEHWQELDLEGLALVEKGKVLAFTLGSALSANTFDIHFEKALTDADGAYAAVNREFARYLREKHPSLEFLNREDDLGLEGLRKAKRSYCPHHMVEKYWVCLLEDGCEY